MSNLSLNHFSIRSIDLDKTVQFFSDVLDLKPGPRPNFPFPGAWLYSGDSSDYANSVVHIISIDKNDPAGLNNTSVIVMRVPCKVLEQLIILLSLQPDLKK